jgi:hypothetical protein
MEIDKLVEGCGLTPRDLVIHIWEAIELMEPCGIDDEIGREIDAAHDKFAAFLEGLCFVISPDTVIENDAALAKTLVRSS